MKIEVCSAGPVYSDDSEDKVLRLGQPSQQRVGGVAETIEYRDIGIVVIPHQRTCIHDYNQRTAGKSSGISALHAQFAIIP